MDALIVPAAEVGMLRALLEAEGFDPAVVRQVLHLVRISEFKRKQAAPGLKVTDRRSVRDGGCRSRRGTRRRRRGGRP